LRKYIFEEVLKVLKKTFVWQRVLAELITLIPSRGNEFIGCPQAKAHITLLPFMDVKTECNSTQQLLE
jgi:hypothetical protein